MYGREGERDGGGKEVEREGERRRERKEGRERQGWTMEREGGRAG